MLASTYSPNVFGTAVLIDASLPLLEKATFPRIINVSSSLGSLSRLSDMDFSMRLLVRNSAYYLNILYYETDRVNRFGSF
jgi:NAD(P)-dependent dehydrogenase (short-subunit alcohol dehydrogenase family)